MQVCIVGRLTAGLKRVMEKGVTQSFLDLTPFDLTMCYRTRHEGKYAKRKEIYARTDSYEAS